MTALVSPNSWHREVRLTPKSIRLNITKFWSCPKNSAIFSRCLILRIVLSTTLSTTVRAVETAAIRACQGGER